jgi:transcriptional regulator NrdR family protein
MSSKASVVQSELIGLNCRKCGHKRLKVIYTRSRPNGVKLRRRECAKCQDRITTWERMIGT